MTTGEPPWGDAHPWAMWATWASQWAPHDLFVSQFYGDLEMEPKNLGKLWTKLTNTDHGISYWILGYVSCVFETNPFGLREKLDENSCFFHPGICVMGHRYVPSKLSWKSMKLKQWLAWFEWTCWKLACATKYSVDRNYNDSMGWFLSNFAVKLTNQSLRK